MNHVIYGVGFLVIIVVTTIMLYKVTASTDNYKTDCVNKGGEVLNVYRGYVCLKPGVIVK